MRKTRITRGAPRAQHAKTGWWQAGGVCIAAIALLLMAIAAGGGTESERFALFSGKKTQQSEQQEQRLPQPSREFSLQVRTSDGLQQMQLEQYILGVVAAEMPASFETEALKAQAVAARTYTLRKMLHGGCAGKQGDICTEASHCQAYCTEQQMRDKWGDSFDAYYAKLQAAVQQTAGQVLAYEGEVIEALFHSSSEGSTEDCAHVFFQDLPYLKSVSTPEAGDESEVSYSYAKCIALAQKALGDCGLSERELAGQIQVLSRYESGRVQTLQLGNREISGNQARTLFSLRSACFSVRTEGGNVVFSVSGYGHGVGMSQRGADALAAQGEAYTQILTHYYTGTTLALAENFLPQ